MVPPVAVRLTPESTVVDVEDALAVPAERVPPTTMRPALVPTVPAVRLPPLMEVSLLPETLIRPPLAWSDPPVTVALVEPETEIVPPSLAVIVPAVLVTPELRRSMVPPVAVRLASVPTVVV